MASKSLGTLTVDIIAKVGGFVAGMTQAEKAAEKAARQIEAKKREMAKRLDSIYGGIKTGATVAFAAIGAAITAAVANGIAEADKFDEVSARLGVGVEKLQELNYAAGLSGVSFEDLSSVFPKLSKAMAESLDPDSKYAEMFKKLGLSAVDAQGNLKDAADFLLEISDVFYQFDDSTGEAALAMEIFGKSGAGLLEFLNRGKDGIEDLMNRARDLGLIIDEETTQSMAELNDRVSEVKTGFTVLGAEIAAQLLPKIMELIVNFQEWMKKGEGAARITEFLGGAMDTAKISLNFLNVGFEIIKGAINGFIIMVGTGIKIIQQFALNAAAVVSAIGRFSPAGVLNAVRNGYAQMEAIVVEGNAQLEAQTIKSTQAITTELDAAWNTLNGTLTENEKKQRAAAAAAAEELARQKALREEQEKASGTGRGSRGKIGADVLVGDPKQTRAKAAKAAKDKLTEEEKAAQKLQERYESLMQSMHERIWMIGKTGEAAKVQYEIEYGELKNLTEEKKQLALAEAARLDSMEKAYEQQKKEQEAHEEAMENAKEMRDEYAFQLTLVGKTREEQELLNAERELGIALMTEEGQQAIQNLKELQIAEEEFAKQADFADSVRQSMSTLFKDVITGSKSAKEAMTDFLDSIISKMLDMAINNLVEQLLGSFGGGFGGSMGGGFQSLFAGFGGGRAVGGPVSANGMYRVNEHGPEMLTVGGKDFLMMGRDSGRVTPNHMLPGGRGTQQTNNFIIEGKIDRRTQEQISGQVGRKIAQSQNRNM